MLYLFASYAIESWRIPRVSAEASAAALQITNLNSTASFPRRLAQPSLALFLATKKPYFSWPAASWLALKECCSPRLCLATRRIRRNRPGRDFNLRYSLRRPPARRSSLRKMLLAIFSPPAVLYRRSSQRPRRLQHQSHLRRRPTRSSLRRLWLIRRPR